MRFSNPIYPITDIGTSGLSHTEQVKRLVGTGVGLIQLREKSVPAREFAEDARTALEIARHANIKIIINDRVDIALALGADGVHLGQTDLLPAQARKILGENAIIGYSTHSAAQAAAAINEPIDYVAAGPVFPTTSKEDPDDVIGLEVLAEIRAIATTMPLVAIGGIGISNIGLVKAAGADATALIGAVFASGSEIESAINNLQQVWWIKNVKR